MSKRLLFLEKTTASGSEDPFVWYCLALEYRSVGRDDEALRTFTTLRTRTPDYVPMYLMCGQLLEKMSQRTEAGSWYEAGILAAKAKKDSHALSELQSALTALGLDTTAVE